MRLAGLIALLTGAVVFGGVYLWGGETIHVDSSQSAGEKLIGTVQILLGLGGLLSIMVGFVLVLVDFSAEVGRAEVLSALSKADELEHGATQEETLVGYVTALLAAAAERQHASVLTAERRAGNLFRVGTFLMGLSVLVPFLLFFVYLNTDPATAVQQLAGAGVPVVEAAKAAQRDWHLLVAGISFGLLFIAAARGILLAETRQREVYAYEVRETAYYGDLTRALNIAQRLDSQRGDANEGTTQEVIRRILALLLERGRREPSPALTGAAGDSGGQPVDHEILKIVTDTLRR